MSYRGALEDEVDVEDVEDVYMSSTVVLSVELIENQLMRLSC